MEIEQQGKSRILDTLAQGLRVIQVLTYRLVAVSRGVYKQADAHGIQPLLLEKGNDIIHALSVLVSVDHSCLLVLGQHGDVTAYIMSLGIADRRQSA